MLGSWSMGLEPCENNQKSAQPSEVMLKLRKRSPNPNFYLWTLWTRQGSLNLKGLYHAKSNFWMYYVSSNPSPSSKPCQSCISFGLYLSNPHRFFSCWIAINSSKCPLLSYEVDGITPSPATLTTPRPLTPISFRWCEAEQLFLLIVEAKCLETPNPNLHSDSNCC